MRICLIAPTPPPYGGVSIWCDILIKEIYKHSDVELHLIDTSSKKRPTDGRGFYDRFIYSGIKMLNNYLKLKNTVLNFKPSVVHMTTSGGYGFIRDILYLRYLKKKGIKTVYHIHFGRAIDYKKNNNWNWKMLKKAVELSSDTIAIDKKTKNVLNEFDNVYYINNPINVSGFFNYKSEIGENITFVGAVIPTKGVEELIIAYNNLRSLYNLDYKLQLVGPISSDYKKYLYEKYQMDGILVCGEMSHEDAMKVLGKSRLFILPSYTEGFPNVILEAMALKKCIIATRVGAIPEVIGDDCGILINPRDVNDIENSIKNVVDNVTELERYGDNAYNKVLNMYDISITYQKYLNVWKS